MKEYKFPFESHIGGWYIPEKVCDNLIKYFYDRKDKWNLGEVGNNRGEYYSNKKVKESLEYPIMYNNFKEKQISDYRVQLQLVLNSYLKKYKYANIVPKFNVIETYKFQYYKKNQGFKEWHHEKVSFRHSKRFLVFMTYLNDVDDGGTKFLYQKITSPAKKGLTLIWPADWTHTHKGEISKTKEKSIITGWFSYE